MRRVTTSGDQTSTLDLSAAAASDDQERAAFHQLQSKLPAIWRAIHDREAFSHTSVVVPSLSFDPEELTKVVGGPFYEERLLFSLIRLRDPRARVVYVTSQPVHPDIIDYYLQHLVGVPASHARARLKMLCVYDASARPLSEKILERPRVLERIRGFLGEPGHAYLTCFNCSPRERSLALALGIPLNGVDPDLLDLGTKSGSRRIFRLAGVAHPPGVENLHGERQVIDALAELKRAFPDLERAVIKLNESFAGTGNADFYYPEAMPDGDDERRQAITSALQELDWAAPEETYASYMRKMESMGGIVEAFVQAVEVRSPSTQMRINPDGSLELISTHDQVLGGPTGQSYTGCRFPADQEYRKLIQDEGMKIAELLRQRGVISRFGVDFVTTRDSADEPWRASAIEINLRMGGTTPPFLALQFLTGGKIDPESGLFYSAEGQEKYYRATDNLRSPSYRGLLPEDLIDILTQHRLHFRPSTETGVLFHMIGALSQYGKIGVTCIGDSRAEADALYRRTVEILDAETGAEPASGPRSFPDLEGGVSPME